MKNFFNALLLFFIFILINQNTAFSQSGVNEHSIKFQNDQIAMLVGENGAILKTIDGGRNWTEQSSGVTNILYGNAYADQNNAFSVGENGLILKTTDGGDSWTIINAGVTDHLKKVVVVNSSTVVVCGENGTILTSHDLGGTWNNNTGITTNNLNYVTSIGTALYIVGANSTVLKSNDGGDSWSTIAFNFGPMNFEAIGGTDENNFTVVGDGYTLLRTTNGGSSWLGVGINQGTINLNDIVFFNATDGVIVGNQGLVLNTRDGGNSWQISDLQTISAGAYILNFMSVAFSSLTNGITVGENGTHYFSTDGGATWSDVLPPAPKQNYNAQKKTTVKLNQNYPNPFNPSTIISYDLPASSSVSLRVYDMLGKEIKTLVNGYQSAGSYNIRFDGSNLSSGIYFYVLKANSNTNEISKTMRMILTK
jgi:photosystem II stability/assembly factor-like uncharacterized protein